jgi:cobalt-zinc-cadmium efflux system membrane fusion protein
MVAGIALTLLLLLAAGRSPASEGHDHDHDGPAPTAANEKPGGAHDHGTEDPHGHDEPEAKHFTVADFERFGVHFATAAAGMVDAGVELPGEVRPNPDRTAHLAPQFRGRVREVRAQVGDTVRAGQVLATIESDTLTPFSLTAAFDGVVVDRHVVAGEVVDPERTMFVIADLSTVWVEINVYQRDLAAVRIGERVRIEAGAGVGDTEGTVSYVSPVLDQSTRTAIARVVLANPDGRWRPGLFVTARVLDPQAAAVVVPRSALQRIDGQSVVFVADGDEVAPRPVRVGRSGRRTAEIVTGLAVGERYAEDGTFLLKAELTAGGDAHEH